MDAGSEIATIPTFEPVFETCEIIDGIIGSRKGARIQLLFHTANARRVSLLLGLPSGYGSQMVLVVDEPATRDVERFSVFCYHNHHVGRHMIGGAGMF